MLTTNLQTAPYLPRQRNFPNNDPNLLGSVLDKSYIEIASRVNERVIGLYAMNYPSVTGEQWFLSGQPNKQQTLRQLYAITLPSGMTPHGINFANISAFTRIYGTFTDGTNWYPLPYVNATSATNQVQLYIDSTNINVARELALQRSLRAL